MRGIPRIARAAAILIAFASVVPDSPAQTAAPASAALEESLAIESRLLEGDVSRHEQLAARRNQANLRLQNLHITLDHVIRQDEDASILEIETLIRDIEITEGEREQILAAQTVAVDRLLDRLRRIQVIQDRLGKARESTVADAGRLTGKWDVVFMPLDMRGVFELTQSGTLVSGTYRLDGGWTGSLQGTLVNRKVYLIRIDSKLGRSMEIEGILAPDDAIIRGTWMNYDLAAQDGAQGQWTATRAE